MIRSIRKGGKKKWKKESGYSRRSLAETAMYRFKQLLGEKLSSRNFMNQSNEAFLNFLRRFPIKTILGYKFNLNFVI